MTLKHYNSGNRVPFSIEVRTNGVDVAITPVAVDPTA